MINKYYNTQESIEKIESGYITRRLIETDKEAFEDTQESIQCYVYEEYKVKKLLDYNTQIEILSQNRKEELIKKHLQHLDALKDSNMKEDFVEFEGRKQKLKGFSDLVLFEAGNFGNVWYFSEGDSLELSFEEVLILKEKIQNKIKKIIEVKKNLEFKINSLTILELENFKAGGEWNLEMMKI